MSGRPAGTNSDETRQRIIAAAMRCVAEVGYSGATIREIARAAQISSGTLYHYFPNKSELLRASRDALIDGVVRPRLRAADRVGGSPADRLDAVLDECGLLMRDYPHLAAFERAMRSDAIAHPDRSDPHVSGVAVLRDVIAGIVSDARRQGVLGADGEGAVDAILALIRGLTAESAPNPPAGYRARLGAAKHLVRGTLF